MAQFFLTMPGNFSWASAVRVNIEQKKRVTKNIEIYRNCLIFEPPVSICDWNIKSFCHRLWSEGSWFNRDKKGQSRIDSAPFTELVGGLPHPPPKVLWKEVISWGEWSQPPELENAYYMPNSRVRNYRDIIFSGSHKGKRFTQKS